jgi:hypothetical protein
MHKHITPLKLAKIKSFWKWFQNNECTILRAITNESERHIFISLDRKLNLISRRIGYAISQNDNKSKKKGTITFTCDGIKKLSFLVHAIIENAPIYTCFELKAFIKPTKHLKEYVNGTDAPFIFEDFQLKVSDIYFTLNTYNIQTKTIKISILLKEYRYHFDNPMFFDALYIMIENLIGEFNMKKIKNNISFAQLYDNNPKLIPLYDLVQLIDLLDNCTKREKNKFI